MENSSIAQIAIVSYDALGDSLIYAMMADNLRKNGYSVTLFSNAAYQLKSWLPELIIQPYPDWHNFYSTLDNYHLVIMSPLRAIRDSTVDIKLEEVRQRYLLICQKASNNWSYDHRSRLKQNLNKDLYQQIEPLIEASGSIQYRRFKKESVIEITMEFMSKKMGLKGISSKVNFLPSKGLIFRKNMQRIIISPDSGWPEKKDWSPERFLKLCFLLEKSGYEPVIVVAPHNYALWSSKSNDRFTTLTFDSIDKLAKYLYESGAVIANDSGNGHLASFLGIPVVTIYRKRNPYFHWRPDWSKTKVICPRIVLPGANGPIWRPFIGVNRIKKELDILLKQFQ